MMLATTAVAQEPSPPATPEAGTPPRQEAQPLPRIDVRRAARRPAAPTHAPAPAAPVQAAPAAGEQTYQATNQTITRLPAPLRDTPQTVNVVTRQVIQEQRTSNVEDALRYIPGITFSAGEGGQQGDGPIIRGFVARGDIFRDGIRDPGWYQRDTFNADRIEIYKGPSAFAFGRGSTGGAINIVSKLPTGASFVDGTVTGTTGPGVRVEVDASGKKDNVSGRVAMLGMDSDTPTRDFVNTKRWGVAPSVAVQMNQTKSTLSYIFQDEDSVPDYGFTYLPQPAYSPVTGALTNPGYNGNGTPTTPTPAPRNNWFGIPNGPLRDITNVVTHIATLKLEHEFDNSWKVANATRYMSNERFSRPTAPRSLGNDANVVFASGTGGGIPSAGFPPDQMTIGRERRERQTDNTFLINQTDFVGKFHTGSLEHSFVTGVELSKETRDQTRKDICSPTNINCRTSLFFPNYAGSPTGGAQVVHLPNSTDTSTIAAYASDQIKVTKFLELLGSVRFDRFEAKYLDPDQAVAANRNLQRTDNMWSYRFGVVLHPTGNSSIYGAYGNSYNPSAELGIIQNASAANLRPEQTKTVEIGAKVDVFNNQLSLTGAVFKIEKEGLRINDPVNTTVQILDGTARVTGLELGAAGKVTNKWSVFGGYAYMETEITGTRDLSTLGRHLPNAPRHTFTLWTTYEVSDNWTIGGGAIYNSVGFANTANTAYVPEYWKFDAMAAYKVTKDSTIQFNIYNITDVLYYAQYFGGNVVPGSGRWASVSWRTRITP